MVFSTSTTCDTTDVGSDTIRKSHVVFLVNFVAPNHTEVLRKVSKKVGKLTVLSSVEMESNRNWSADVGDLDVIVQRTKTIARSAKHPSGFSDANYVHIPWATTLQLRKLNPDVVVSLEMGARTAFSALHKSLSRRCALVTAVYASERSEAGRGFLRRMLRRHLIQRADWLTFNGPSCQRYLESLGADPNRMSAWDYAADPSKPFRGEREFKPRNDSIRLLTVGQLSERKGVVAAARQLAQWANANREVTIQWNIVGTGPCREQLESSECPTNLQLVFHDHCDPNQLRDFYRDNDAMLFPTLVDEWGLVTDEALHSGLPVLGSIHAQSVTTLIQDGSNGWQYDPTKDSSLTEPLTAFTKLSLQDRSRLSANARESAIDRTPERSAAQFVSAACHALQIRRGLTSPNSPAPKAVGSAEDSIKHEMTAQ